MDYLIHIITMIAIWVILSIPFNLVLGFAGIFALCQAAFWGIGAYTGAILMVKLGWPFIPALAAAAIIGGIVSLCISLPALRIHWDYMVVASFGFQYAIYHLILNWVPLTGGPMGIKAIPAPQYFDSGWAFALLCILIAGVVFILCRQIARSSFGLGLKATRDQEVAARSLGRRVLTLKVSLFAVNGAFAAIAGVLYAVHISYIAPYDFVLHYSFVALCMVAIGGSGNLWGTIAGVAILFGVPELLRFLALPSVMVGALRQTIYGVFLIFFMLFRPQGLFPETHGISRGEKEIRGK
jgi:branched-chain amino acid transport system permease protein